MGVSIADEMREEDERRASEALGKVNPRDFASRAVAGQKIEVDQVDRMAITSDYCLLLWVSGQPLPLELDCATTRALRRALEVAEPIRRAVESHGEEPYVK